MIVLKYTYPPVFKIQKYIVSWESKKSPISQNISQFTEKNALLPVGMTAKNSFGRYKHEKL